METEGEVSGDLVDMAVQLWSCVDKGLPHALDTYLDALLTYKCCPISARVSQRRLEQGVLDRLYTQGLVSEHIIRTGVVQDGLPDTVCPLDTPSLMASSTDPVPLLCGPETPDSYPYGYLLVEECHEQPGYVRLEIEESERLPSELVSKVRTDAGCVYATSEWFRERESFPGTFLVPVPVPEGEEPVYNEYGQHRYHPTTATTPVSCLHLHSWPSCASEFLTRPRPHGWPGKPLLENVTNAGCHILPEGEPLSDHKDIEWRWSFVVVEKELSHDMGEPMLACMYALLLLKRLVWKEENGLNLSSAFSDESIRTACLWVCESSPREGVSVMRLCNLILDWLVTCFRDNSLPHYVMPECNVIGHVPQAVCEKICGQLAEIQCNLSNVLLSCLARDEELLFSLKALCVKLGYSPIILEGDSGELATAISQQDNAAAELLGAANFLRPDGQIFAMFQQDGMSTVTSGHPAALFDVLEFHIRNGMPLLDLAAMLGSIVLPMIDSIHGYVKPGFESMFRVSLYRHLGDIYHTIYTHLTGVATLQKRKFYDQASQYYILGREMVLPDWWSDQGLGGYVLLAKLYYLSGEWTQLELILRRLSFQLNGVLSSSGLINRLSFITLHPTSGLSMSPWKADKVLHDKLMQEDGGDCIHIHHILLLLYIMGRCALRPGKVGGEGGRLAERWVENMKACADKIQEPKHRRMAPVLIGIIEDLLDEYNNK